jgi:hypothetical protein
VLLVSVFAWSATAQPQPTTPKPLYDITGAGPVKIDTTCTVLENQWLNLYDFVHHLAEGMPTNPKAVVTAMDAASKKVAIPQLTDDLRIFSGVVTKAQTEGVNLIDVAGAMSPDEHDRYLEAVERLVFFVADHCHAKAVTPEDVAAARAAGK